MYSNTKFINKLIYNVDGFVFKMDDTGHFEASHKKHGYFEIFWTCFSNKNGIRGFIKDLDGYYITSKLGGKYETVFDPQGTSRNIRRFIDEEYKYESKAELKLAKQEIRQLERSLRAIGPKYIMSYHAESKILNNVLSCEPHHFLSTKLNKRIKACIKAFQKLQDIVKKELEPKL